MNPSPENQEKLEQLIHRTLRSLPDRRAPHTLEARVLAAVEARALRPWWQKSYTEWPLAARCTFLLLSAGFVKFALMAAVWVMGDFEPGQFTNAFATQLAWMNTARTLFTGTGEFFALLFRSIPPLWLYGGLAFVATMYVALFGLGAAAYRALYANR